MGLAARQLQQRYLFFIGDELLLLDVWDCSLARTWHPDVDLGGSAPIGPWYTTVFFGDQPSCNILLKDLETRTLGQFEALFKRRIESRIARSILGAAPEGTVGPPRLDQVHDDGFVGFGERIDRHRLQGRRSLAVCQLILDELPLSGPRSPPHRQLDARQFDHALVIGTHEICSTRCIHQRTSTATGVLVRSRALMGMVADKDRYVRIIGNRESNTGNALAIIVAVLVEVRLKLDQRIEDQETDLVVLQALAQILGLPMFDDTANPIFDHGRDQWG